MWMNRGLGAAILYGGWVLLFNPQEHAPPSPTVAWKKVREYDTAYLCEQGRREKVESVCAKEAKRSHRDPRTLAADTDARYRCERAERAEAQKRR